MKKIISFLILFSLTLPALHAQDTLTSKPNLSKAPNNAYHYEKVYDKDYYLQKSHKMKTMGFIMLGAGAGLTIGGIIMYNDAMNSQEWEEGIFNVTGSYVAIITGSALVVTSIPILIVAGNYKKKAMQLSTSLKLEPYKQLNQASLATNWVPSLSLTLSLP